MKMGSSESTICLPILCELSTKNFFRYTTRPCIVSRSDDSSCNISPEILIDLSTSKSLNLPVTQNAVNNDSHWSLSDTSSLS